MLNDPMSKFTYHPSYDTDLRRTFRRVRKALRAQQQPAPQRQPAPADPTHVVPMRKRSRP